MRGPIRFLVLVLVALLWPGRALAQEQADPTPVSVIDVEGAIDRPLLRYLTDALDEAESRGAVVVLALDTAGTLNENGVALADKVAELHVPVLTWVGPVPATAAGAGLLLMYASSLAAVSPGSQTGPLRPIDLAHPDREFPGLDLQIARWTEDRGKEASRSEVDKPLTAQDALDLGIAQEAALSVPDLLNKVDGRIVQTAGGPVELHTRIATDQAQAEEGTVEIRFDNIGPIGRVLHGVATPSMVYFLLVLGLACIAFELTQPGFGFAGFAGIFLLALAAYGIWIVPPTWYGALLMLGGIAMLIYDVHLRRFGVFTAAGLVAFTAGSFLAWNTTVAPAIEISPWLIVGAAAASLLYYGFGLTVAIQSRDRIANTQRGLIGLVGEARGTLAPEGTVFVKGSLWRGRSTGDEIPAGAKIRVRSVEGLVLRVEQEPDPEAEAPAG